MITLNVFVRVKPEHREELLEVGHTLFAALAKEPTFIDAWINAAVDHPELVVVYERWNETKESFVQNILPKPYYAPYLALLEKVGLGREVFWLEERGSWRAEASNPNDA
jgi:quinol monooxygenase YgiN